MKEITEDYVSFETAKLLKEKGFDEKCFQYWHEKDNELVHSRSVHPIRNITNPCLFGPAAPPIQMAMKWLRVNYNIHIEPRYFPMPSIYRYVIIHSPTTIENIDSHPQYFNTYEEACEAAIKYCLEILI